MNKRTIIFGLALLGLAAVFVIYRTFTAASVAPRPVRLVVTGPDGQRFEGSYVADGNTNTVSAIAPATIEVVARDVAYTFIREGGEGEFRVALFVGDLCRTSTTSGQREGIRGELRYAPGRESCSAWAF